MPANGFIGFITSQGFFIGMIFGVVKFDDPIAILFASLVVTGLFYMLGQISVSYFVRAIAVRAGNFPKLEHEIMLDEFAKAIQKREDIFNDVDPVRVSQSVVPEIVPRSEIKEEE
jgi:hypothetical protein